jgi:hypothetical protein
MNSPALRVAWYRFRATFRRRWSGYVALAALVGLVGGVALASVAAARRTDSSYPDFLASTNPSDLIVQPTTAAVGWQATVTAGAGLVIGVPLGIAAGRWLWLAFASELAAVPDPVIPAASIALAAAAALILANLVAAVPASGPPERRQLPCCERSDDEHCP